MGKLVRFSFFLVLLAPLLAPAFSCAQTADLSGWHSGAVELTSGWVTHAGDNPAWAGPGFDDSGWTPVELDNMGASPPGWRWFRVHVKLARNHPDVQLLIVGGNGTYELYANGQRVNGPYLSSPFGTSRPTERVIPIDQASTDLELALRTHAPLHYTSWHMPLFLDCQLGTPDAIETAREAAQSRRLYQALPSIAINLLLILAGLVSLALSQSQRTQREYVWLGLYLLLLGVNDLLLYSATNGLIPLDWSDLLGDPLVYFFTIMQIEFTFSFAGQHLGRVWRGYEGLLTAMVALNWLTYAGVLSISLYVLIQAAVLLPAAFALPALLLLWYCRGNLEAAWLIVPSLMPGAASIIFDLGFASIVTGWGRLNFLANPIPIGPISLQLTDSGDFLFLLAIGIVMFFRFARVSREQTRASAELDAAREIQQQLVPAALPRIQGLRFAAAYVPAAEVGGDFYQVFPERDGSALIIVGDVSGKGLKAAMKGTLVLGTMRTLAQESLSPAQILDRVNILLAASSDGGFVTCLCIRIASDGALTFANAAHLPPYRNGEELSLTPGLPLGITADTTYAESRLQLTAGDTLTFLSDGVVEAQSATGELFGFERTRSISTQSAEQIATAAQAFGQQDDITVLTLTFAPAEVVHA